MPNSFKPLTMGSDEAPKNNIMPSHGTESSGAVLWSGKLIGTQRHCGGRAWNLGACGTVHGLEQSGIWANAA